MTRNYREWQGHIMTHRCHQQFTDVHTCLQSTSSFQRFNFRTCCSWWEIYITSMSQSLITHHILSLIGTYLNFRILHFPSFTFGRFAEETQSASRGFASLHVAGDGHDVDVCLCALQKCATPQIARHDTRHDTRYYERQGTTPPLSQAVVDCPWRPRRRPECQVPIQHKICKSSNLWSGSTDMIEYVEHCNEL